MVTGNLFLFHAQLASRRRGQSSGGEITVIGDVARPRQTDRKLSLTVQAALALDDPRRAWLSPKNREKMTRISSGRAVRKRACGSLLTTPARRAANGQLGARDVRPLDRLTRRIPILGTALIEGYGQNES